MSEKIADIKPLTGKTVLVVEDDSLILKVYTKWLTIAGAHVVIAHDGVGGLAMLDTHTIDIVLLDLGMPGMNGYETLARIREKFTPSELPVVVISNTTIDRNGTNFETLSQAGVTYILRKYETSLAEIVHYITSHFPEVDGRDTASGILKGHPQYHSRSGQVTEV